VRSKDKGTTEGESARGQVGADDQSQRHDADGYCGDPACRWNDSGGHRSGIGSSRRAHPRRSGPLGLAVVGRL